MHTRLFLVALACFALSVSACQPAPTSPPDDDQVAESSTSADEQESSEADVEDSDSESDADADEFAADEAEAEADADLDDESDEYADEAPEVDQPAAAGGELVASVNGEPIELAEFQRQAFETQRYFVEQGLDPNTDDGQRRLRALRRQVLDDMINQKLIEQAGVDLGIEVTDEELDEHLKMQIENVGGQESFDETLLEAGTTLDEVVAMERSALMGKKVLDSISGDIPETAEFIHARHILCESQEECDDALERLESGDDFEDVAKEVSIDSSSADRGGDLDWVGRGMLPSQQVEDAIFALDTDERSGVVTTDFGYHIFEAIEHDAEHALTSEQKYQLQEKALLDWLSQRRIDSVIEIFVDDLKDPEE